MSLLSSIGNLIKKILSSIVKAIKNLLKKLWPLLLIIAIIYFAPAITGFLATSGAPAWLSGAFGWIGTNVTPILTSALSSIWAGVKTVGSTAWSAYRGLELSTQASIAVGAAALIAPEETAAVISDVAELAVDVVGTVGSGLLEGLTSSTLGTVVLVGGGLWLLFTLFGSKKSNAK